MITNGYILLHRKLMDSPLWTQLPDAWLKVWITILLRANFRASKWWDGNREIELPAGAFVTSIEKLAALSFTTNKQVRGTLKYLEAAGAVARRTASKYTVLSVTNWDAYQSFDHAEGKQNGKQNGTKRAGIAASEGQAEGKQRATEESIKALTQQNILTLGAQGAPECSPADAVTEWFDAEFWPTYPRKKNRLTALKAAKRCAKSATARQQIMDGLNAQLPTFPRDMTFIPHASTWLNEQQWLNPPEPARSVIAESRMPSKSEALRDQTLQLLKEKRH